MEIKMTIIYEKADGLIQASVAELPGAISLGSSVEEARKNLDEAIEMVLEEIVCSQKMVRAKQSRARKLLSARHERVDLVRHLERHGCEFVREGREHTLYI